MFRQFLFLLVLGFLASTTTASVKTAEGHQFLGVKPCYDSSFDENVPTVK